MGASLAHVHVPGREKSEDKINSGDEVEIGMGIHNEEGFGRVTTDLPGLVKTVLAQLLDPGDKDRAFVTISSSDATVLMVNNLGGVSPLELGAITEVVCEHLRKDYGIQPVRVLSGTYMTSLNGLGFSVSILKLSDTGLGAGYSMLDFVDASTGATAWPATIPASAWSKASRKSEIAAGVEQSGLEESHLKGKPSVFQHGETSES